MFLNNQYCYVDMNKTGTVYVNNILKKINNDYYCKHHEIPSDKVIESNIIKFGTIRDPFSWYVSLWSYGCLKNQKSGMYNNLTRFKIFSSYGTPDNKIKALFKKNIAYINLNLKFNTQALYNDLSNPILFRKWLKIVLSEEFAPIVDYPMYNSNLYKHCGPFTARMIKFYFKNHRINNGKINLHKGLRSFLEDNCYLDDFIELNNLGRNLVSFFKKYNFHIGEAKQKFHKQNTASIKIEHYDRETYNLVLDKEHIMINYMKDKWNINLNTKYEYFK